jgi:DNA helicase-2/ATP-dependent DNA helicase PcrA
MPKTTTLAYTNAYKRLNDRQREVVDHMFGPLMVVAGPGTGKTQILACRIGSILLNSDTEAHNILCLTYTEAGVTAMRDRLIRFIGPTAYNVSIHTFHSFCNRVIQENPEVFESYGELQPADNLDKAEVFEKLFADLPASNPLKGKRGVNDYDRSCIFNLIDWIRNENVDTTKLKKDLIGYRESLPTLEEFQYKRKYKEFQAGDPKQKEINKEENKIDKTIAGIDCYQRFVKIMEERNLYDFTDMILWVLRAFQSNEDLLLQYREQFQFILTDEYQDTNGAQNEILFALAGPPEENPNVMVVGDDDQAIYRFQGANLGNILEFNDRFKDHGLHLVFLNKNYRSAQPLIDAATKLIAENEERLAAKVEGIEKTFEAAGPNADYPGEPIFKLYADPVAEVAGIVSEMEDLIKRGTKPEYIAVLYRKHRHSELLIKLLQERRIPYQVRKKDNALSTPPIRQILCLIEYLVMERKGPFSGNALLFEILHYPFWNLLPLDVARFSYAMHERGTHVRWREGMADKDFLQSIGINDLESWEKCARTIDHLLIESFNQTPQNLLEIMIHKTGMLRSIMEDPQRLFFMGALSTFDDFVKDKASRSTGQSLEDVLRMIRRLEDFNLPLDTQDVVADNEGVQLLTAHGSKGLEFGHVFIIGAASDQWENQRGQNRNFKLPPGYAFSNLDATTVEDERRLFYVAMTRTERQLHMSSYAADTNGRDKQVSRFIVEAIDGQPEDYHEMVKEEILMQVHALRFTPVKFDRALLEDKWLDEAVSKIKISPTALNKYLRCPVAFYYENILRVPSGRNADMGFGSAIHYALEHYFREMLRSGKREFPPVESLLDWFEHGMERYHSHFLPQEFKDRSEYGKLILEEYHKANIQTWQTYQEIIPEYMVRDVHINGIPVSGKFDRIDKRFGDYYVLDYKTGNPAYAKIKLKGPDRDPLPWMEEEDPNQREKARLKAQGQDYWRQLVFYKLLMDADPRHSWQTRHGVVSFIEPDKQDQMVEMDLEVNAEDESVVLEQLEATYKAIQNKEFDRHCGLENCRWCQFFW